MFKKEEDYVNLIYLERVFFDLINNIIFKNDEHKKIRLFFRLSLIENYIKSLSEIKIKILYDENKCENPFAIKFPNVGYMDICDLEGEIWGNLEDLQNNDFENKFLDLVEEMKYLISAKYYEKKLYHY